MFEETNTFIPIYVSLNMLVVHTTVIAIHLLLSFVKHICMKKIQGVYDKNDMIKYDENNHCGTWYIGCVFQWPYNIDKSDWWTFGVIIASAVSIVLAITHDLQNCFNCYITLFQMNIFH